MKTNIYHITYTPEQKDVCVHFWGCNFKCKGCYCTRQVFSPMLDFSKILSTAPASFAKPPTRFLTLEEVEKVLDELDFHSVVIEGQEAGLDPAYPEFTRLCHNKYGARVTLVTNARVLPDLSFTDTLEVGLKALDEKLHLDYTGVSNTETLRNFELLVASGKRLVVDSVLIPGYIGAAEIGRIASYVASHDHNIPFILLPYFPSGDNPWHRPAPEEMDEAASIAKISLSRVFHFRGDETLKYPIYNVFPTEACPGNGIDAVKWLTRVSGLNRRPDSVLDEIFSQEVLV
ncbi:radical SAM protein [Dehalogenimonas formicexedens]|nr:radical SAM protein [Dehalogenimonas formicexedens]